MKVILIAPLVLWSAVTFAQGNMFFSAGYIFAVPTGGMKQTIQYGNGGFMAAHFGTSDQRVNPGFEFGVVGYGQAKSIQMYQFPDGSSAPMKVVVDNTYLNLMASVRINLLVSGPVRPYAVVKGGYTRFATNLGIFDPDETDSCHPVESAILSHDGTLVYSAGGGVRFDLAWLFKKLERDRYYLDLSSQVLQGGRVKYMSEDPPSTTNLHNGSGRAQDVTADFVNTETQVIHPHHVGYLYNNFVQMIDFRFTLTARIATKIRTF